MLKSLYIKNYAIIEELQLDFCNALNIITGETGAGKSIMLGALSLILGQRADASVLRDKDAKAIVEAVFTNLSKESIQFLTDQDIDVSNQEIVIRRIIMPNGKSRAFVEDEPTNLKVLQFLAGQNIDLNRQHQLLEIQQSEFQLKMIDALAKTKLAFSAYQKDYKSIKKQKQELSVLKEKEQTGLKEFDYLKFLHEELDSAAIVQDEEKELENKLAILEKSEELITLSSETQFSIFENENSLRNILQSLQYKWQKFEGINTQLDEQIELFNQIDDLLQQLSKTNAEFSDSDEFDMSAKTELEARFDLINQLNRKHQVNNSQELQTVFDEIDQKINNFSSLTGQISDLEKVIQQKEKELIKIAKNISTSRQKHFKSIETEVNDLLHQLNMPSASIHVDHHILDEIGPTGLDDIQILFKANKGSVPQAIKNVASGGETSRLMLCMKATVGDAIDVDSLIFDEIDTGVSGEVATKMGKLLANIASSHQVISITHSPQVAAQGDKHFFIAKNEEGDFTKTIVDILEGEKRIHSLAEMLSGKNPSDAAIANAKELLKG